MLRALCAGALCSVGVLFPNLFVVSVFGFALFIHQLMKYERGSFRAVFAASACFGFAYCGGVHLWLWYILPLDWLGIHNGFLGFLLILFYWSTIALFFGVIIALFAVPFVAFRPGRPLHDALFAASLWTLMQYVQMWGTSLVTAGSGSLFGAHYSTVMLGYAFSNIPSVLYLARFGGIFAMTFVFVFVAMMALHASEGWLRDRTIGFEARVFGACILALLAASFIPFGTSTGKTLPVGLVTTNFELLSEYTPEKMVDVVREMIRNDTETSSKGMLYMLPEEITFSPETADASFLEKIDASGSGVMFSDVVESNGKRVRMFLYAGGTTTGFYDKMLLSPQGEYGPWFYLVWLRLFGTDALVEKSIENYTFKRGDATRIANFAGTHVGALFCSDILSPQLYRFLARDGAQIFAESTSLAWFHSSPILNSVMLSLAKVRAAENGRYLVVAGNVTPSLVISDTGAVVARSERGFSVLKADIPLLSEKTPYTRLGESVLLPLLGVIAWYAWARRSRKILE